MSTMLTFAAAHGADRIVALGVLGLRALHYVAEGRPAAGPPVEGLHVTAVGAAERPGWHQATGLYGFLRLPPGPRRLLVTDPARRFQAAALNLVVPDRSAVRRQLEQGVETPEVNPRPLLGTVALHLAPGQPLRPGLTAVQGVVRDAEGRPVALARLALETLLEGALRRHHAWSEADGSYLLPLPGERPDSIGGNPPWRAERVLSVHAPRPSLRAALAADWLAALPAERDAIDPDAAGSPWERRSFTLRAADGTTRAGAGGADPTLEILGGRQTRWDIELA